VDDPAVAAEDALFLRRIARTFYGVAGPAYKDDARSSARDDALTS
jgi:hypothetical protein